MTAMLSDEVAWQQLHDSARRNGPERALARAHADIAPHVIVAGPAGHAVAPAALARSASRAWPSGAPVDRRPGAVTVFTPVPLERSGLMAVRGLAVPGGRAGYQVNVAYRGWLLTLSWLRLGISAGLLDTALSYLAHRTVAGEPLLRKQMIQGELSDAVTRQLAVRALVSGRRAADLSDTALADAHRQITAGDGVLLRLMGARGLTVEWPGQAAYASELLADAYLSR